MLQQILILTTVLPAGLVQGLENTGKIDIGKLLVRAEGHMWTISIPFQVSTLSFLLQIHLCRKKVASRSCHFYNNVEGKTKYLKPFLLPVVRVWVRLVQPSRV